MVFFAIASAAASAMGLSACGDDSSNNDDQGISDTCRDPAQNVTLDTLEVGVLSPDGAFTAIAADQTLPIVYGGQGLAMLELYIEVTGSAVPDCLRQQTLVRNSDSAIAGDLLSPLSLYAQEGGVFRTKTVWLILYPNTRPGDPLTLRTEAGGLSFERAVKLEP